MRVHRRVTDDVAHFRVTGRHGPYLFAGDTEHDRDTVIPERHHRGVVLPTWTRDGQVSLVGVQPSGAPRDLK